MPGLDPGIYEATQNAQIVPIQFVDIHHGLPGQARQ
jgi:hypothetical protein